jgi:hypothetical protein
MRDGQLQDNRKATKVGAAEPDVAAIEPRQVPHDRQTETAAQLLAVPSLTDTEHNLESFRRQSGAVIVDPDLHRARSVRMRA